MRAPAAPDLVTWLLLLAAALVGGAWLAFLPPFEGFDETAHWSYVQELADTGRAPRYGVDGLSRDLRRYPGPMTYSGASPYDRTGRITYRSYRLAGAPTLSGGPERYGSGGEANWQAQHPPLYYALMVPVHRAARGLGWRDDVLALRLASWALAWTGYALGVLASRRLAERYGPWTAPVVAAWPFLVPQFFPEFARMGNDSLCLLCMGAAWACLVRLLEGRTGGWKWSLALGVALGAGLLTKAFFLPIGVGVGALLLARAASERRGWRTGLAQTVLAGVTALAIGGWWYVRKRLETGSLTGSDEFIRLHQGGGWRLIADNFDWGDLGHGLLEIGRTFLWAGSWSMARPPSLLLVPPAVLLTVAGADYLRRLAQGGFGVLAWAPTALCAPMAAGLVYHVFVWMAGVSAETPGWYLHILAAPLGLAVALGWRRTRVLGVSTALTLAATAVLWVLQLSLWSGCAAKLGSEPRYDWSGADCFVDPRVLARLGHPAVGAVALSLGLAAGLAAAAIALRAHRADPASPPPPRAAG